MNKPLTLTAGLVIAAVFCTSAMAEINRVRVVNETGKSVYIHKGGFAPSVKIKPGGSHIFYYPFYVIPPNSTQKIATTKIIATSGGRWMTTPNGFTFLENPTLSICLDYKTGEHQSKSGNRVWTINKAIGVETGCAVKGYKQPWYQPG